MSDTTRPLKQSDTLAIGTSDALTNGVLTALEGAGYVVVEADEIRHLIDFAQVILNGSTTHQHEANVIQTRLRAMLGRLQAFERETAMNRAARVHRNGIDVTVPPPPHRVGRRD